MTVEEVQAELAKILLGRRITAKSKKAVQMAIEALQMLISMPPEPYEDEWYDGKCPRCGTKLPLFMDKCKECGQMIKWEGK